MHDTTTVIGQNQYSGTTSGHFRFLAVGFHLLAAFWVLSAFFPSEGLTLENVTVSALLLLSVLCLALQVLLEGRESREEGRFDRLSLFLILLLLAWGLVTIFRALPGAGMSRLLTLLANPYIGGVVWLLPGAVYIGRRPGCIDALMPVFRAHTIIGIVLVIWSMVEFVFLRMPLGAITSQVGFALLYPAPFVLLTGLGGRFERIFYFSCLSLALVVQCLLFVHRSLIASILGVLILSAALGRVRDVRRLWSRIIGLSILFFIFILFGLDYLLPRLQSAWFVDTRTFLWLEMRRDFGPVDWIIGRGALGTYYSPYFSMTSIMGITGAWMDRPVNEIGYLHIVLKAGLIGAVLYLFIYLRAVWRSLFAGRTRFELGVGLLLSMHLLEMTVGGAASFSLSRVLLWLMVGVVLSKASRRTLINE